MDRIRGKEGVMEGERPSGCMWQVVALLFTVTAFLFVLVAVKHLTDQSARSEARQNGTYYEKYEPVAYQQGREAYGRGDSESTGSPYFMGRGVLLTGRGASESMKSNSDKHKAWLRGVRDARKEEK